VIRDTSKTQRPIRDTSSTQRSVNPDKVAKLLGAGIVFTTTPSHSRPALKKKRGGKK